MEFKKINWVGLAGGIATIFMVVLSLVFAYPWWQITIGEEVGHAYISALNYDVKLLGNAITIPIVWFLNLTAQLSLITSAIVILIYSVIPDKSYSKHMLGFAYKKPLITLILFLVALAIIIILPAIILNANIPIMGSRAVSINVGSVTVSVPVSTGFTTAFWIAIVSAGICVAAPLYHKKFISTKATTTTKT